jgi:hypothetical protein
MMKPFQKQVLDWQSPFVDVFKTFNAFDVKENQKGNVVDMQVKKQHYKIKYFKKKG